MSNTATKRMDIRFVSPIPHKVAEATEILAARGITIVPVSMKI